MPRYALLIEYDGRPFSGWQRQASLPSVQGVLETAAARLQQAPSAIYGAGRTDAGVHATGQVAHIDLERAWPEDRLRDALNAHVRPHPVAVVAVRGVENSFHARFDAVEREYLFRLVVRRPPLVLDRGLAWRVPRPLSPAAMRDGAAHLVGHLDFTTFRSSICQAKSAVRTLDEISITERPYPLGTELRFTLRARSFLHNQVRSIVGTLERVGCGAWPPERVGEALRARDRAACGPVCPPDGLYLRRVRYPDGLFDDVSNAHESSE